MHLSKQLSNYKRIRLETCTLFAECNEDLIKQTKMYENVTKRSTKNYGYHPRLSPPPYCAGDSAPYITYGSHTQCPRDPNPRASPWQPDQTNQTTNNPPVTQYGSYNPAPNYWVNLNNYHVGDIHKTNTFNNNKAQQ